MPDDERPWGHDDARAPGRGEPGMIPNWDMAPGGPRAVSLGCQCSVLANAGYRSRAQVGPFIDPRCPVHVSTASD